MSLVLAVKKAKLDFALKDRMMDTEENNTTVDRDTVKVMRCSVFFDDWAWSTLMNLNHDVSIEIEHPGEDKIIEIGFKILISNGIYREQGSYFANPMYLIASKTPSKRFMIEARYAQHAWFRRAKDILGSSASVKRQMKRMSPIIRQLSHTGVLFIDGKHRFPDQWPDINNGKRAGLTKGQQLGRLTIVEFLPRKHCRCKCQCGQETVVRTQHLKQGKTKSCGCWKRKIEQRQKNRKFARAR